VALNRRPRQSPAADEREIEAFAERAELPRPERQDSPSAVAAVDWRSRNKEPKTTGLNFRLSKSQSALLQEAAADQDISQQKVLERIVWPLLEEKYGSGAK
jgi:hypothetical protein